MSSRSIRLGASAALLCLSSIAPGCAATGDTETAVNGIAATDPPRQTDRTFNFDLVRAAYARSRPPRCKTVCTRLAAHRRTPR
jgi:hypothetical protein